MRHAGQTIKVIRKGEEWKHLNENSRLNHYSFTKGLHTHTVIGLALAQNAVDLCNVLPQWAPRILNSSSHWQPNLFVPFGITWERIYCVLMLTVIKNNKLTWMCLSATQNVLLHRSVLVFTPPWQHLNRLGLYVVLRSSSIVLGGSNKHPNQCMQLNSLNLISRSKE